MVWESSVWGQVAPPPSAVFSLPPLLRGQPEVEAEGTMGSLLPCSLAYLIPGPPADGVSKQIREGMKDWPWHAQRWPEEVFCEPLAKELLGGGTYFFHASQNSGHGVILSLPSLEECCRSSMSFVWKVLCPKGWTHLSVLKSLEALGASWWLFLAPGASWWLFPAAHGLLPAWTAPRVELTPLSLQ